MYFGACAMLKSVNPIGSDMTTGIIVKIIKNIIKGASIR